MLQIAFFFLKGRFWRYRSDGTVLVLNALSPGFYPAILASWGWRQKDQEFKVILIYAGGLSWCGLHETVLNKNSIRGLKSLQVILTHSPER